MKIAVISDIHSNCFALENVLIDIQKSQCELVCCLGDIFGYYPWAFETYEIIRNFNLTWLFIKGNHDNLIENITAENVTRFNSEYADLALHNKLILLEKNCLSWLKSIKNDLSFKVGKYWLSMYHGTPENIMEGRYYPDDKNVYAWFPNKNEILLLGHTHYPIIHNLGENNFILNPGSVGQPRDGDTRASWILLDLSKNIFENKRVEYPVEYVVQKLVSMNWNKRAILALQKNYKGKLIV
jgi:putative phosphoesterase